MGVGRRNTVVDIIDDLLVEILSHLPARPLFRFERVSRAWRDLISHPDHRRRFAQPLMGFFHRPRRAQGPPNTTRRRPSFTALYPPARPGSPPPLVVDPAFPFLPSTYSSDDAELLDSCNGLLLLRCRRAADQPAAADPFYVVCNPTTEDWVELPQPIPAPAPTTATALDDLDLVHGGDHLLQLQDVIDPDLHDFLHQSLTTTGWAQAWKNPAAAAALAFDPAVSPHAFHVFLLMETFTVTPGNRNSSTAVTAVQIYSSETGRWVLRDSEWGYVIACTGGHHAYHDGFLHLTTADKGMVASVDTAGRAWRTTRVPPDHPAAALGDAAAFLGRSQRRLLYVDTGSGYAPELSVYALERGGGAERWVLKHRTKSLGSSSGHGQMWWFGKHHSVMAIHPDSAVIFLFDSRRKRVVAYDMDRRKASIVHNFTDAPYEHRYFPYVPLYAQIKIT